MLGRAMAQTVSRLLLRSDQGSRHSRYVVVADKMALGQVPPPTEQLGFPLSILIARKPHIRSYDRRTINTLKAVVPIHKKLAHPNSNERI